MTDSFPECHPRKGMRILVCVSLRWRFSAPIYVPSARVPTWMGAERFKPRGVIARLGAVGQRGAGSCAPREAGEEVRPRPPPSPQPSGRRAGRVAGRPLVPSSSLWSVFPCCAGDCQRGVTPPVGLGFGHRGLWCHGHKLAPTSLARSFGPVFPAHVLVTGSGELRLL